MLKLGIIGTHIITDQMLDAAKTTGKYKLTTVYSRTLDRAKEFGQPYGATEFYDDLDRFFSDGDFDVVYVASPNSLHYQQVRKAIENDKFILDKVKDKNPIIVLNKNDLKAKIDKSKLDFKHIVSTNTNTLDGIEPLKEEIKSMFKLSEIKEDNYTYLANERQLSLAKQALKSLGDAKKSLESDEPVDIIEIDLKEVFDILGSITGESYSDELLDELFANFCVGK